MRAALGLALLLLVASPASAQRSLVIQSFDAAITVSADGSVLVEETIVTKFTGSWNGLYRTIPVEYRTPQGLNYTLRLDVESAADGEGHALKYGSSRERHYRKFKIWIPGAVDTTRTVKLRYRVANALRFFDEHDELYWNVTGDEWDMPIASVSAHVDLPAGVSGVRATAFRGAYGSTEQAAVSVEPDGVRVELPQGVGFKEGLTVVAGWNPGVVHRPTAIERTTNLLHSNLPLGIPLLVFVGMWRLWHARGRDPRLAPIAARYEPPVNLTPAEVGTLVDGKPDLRDITASVVDLAVRGYLHIAETTNEYFFGLFSNKDYTFTLKKPQSEWRALKTHEQHLLGAMFGSGNTVSLSDLKNKFYKHLPALKDELYKMLVRDGFYTGRPDRVRVLYIIGGVIVGFVIAVVGSTYMMSLAMQPVASIIAGILSGLIIVFFGWHMPSRTTPGTRELEKVLGFQEFLSRVEADRLERVVKTPEMFEKFLPYAMALGVEDNWARAFDGIYREPPQWYSGPFGGQVFRPSTFTSDLGRMSAQAAAVMASAPRSSGGTGFSGGSSGGGFGGGGGGGF